MTLTGVPGLGAEAVSPETATPTSWQVRWLPRVAAVVAGGALALAFPEANAWWWAWIGVAPVVALVAGAPGIREAAWRAWLAGTAFFLAAHHWLVPVTGPLALPAAGAVALLWLPWALLARRLLAPPLSVVRVMTAVVVVPSAWVAAELVRSWEHLGGPWALLGATQWQRPAALALAAAGGVWLLGFALVAVNLAIVVMADRRAPATARLAAGGVAVLIAASGPVLAAVQSEPRDPPTVRVAAVQPGVIGGTRARLAAHERSTRAVARARPDIVVWGESSVGFDPAARPGTMDRLARLSADAGAPLLVNVDARRGRGGIFKSSVLVGPEGVEGRYDKMRLVPFGEFIPARSAFGWVARFTDAANEDRRRGTSLAVLRFGQLQVGPLVCFESAFPDLTRHLARRGVDVVVVQTATTTFQGTWAQAQHASLAAVRAAESGRPVVHASLSGVTAAFDARGRRLAWLPAGDTGVIVADVPLERLGTGYARVGDALPYASLAVTLVGLAFGFRPTPWTRARSRAPQPDVGGKK